MCRTCCLTVDGVIRGHIGDSCLLHLWWFVGGYTMSNFTQYLCKKRGHHRGLLFGEGMARKIVHDKVYRCKFYRCRPVEIQPFSTNFTPEKLSKHWKYVGICRVLPNPHQILWIKSEEIKYFVRYLQIYWLGDMLLHLQQKPSWTEKLNAVMGKMKMLRRDPLDLCHTDCCVT